MRSDTGKRFSERLKKEVATAISTGEITIADARRLHGIKGGNTLKGWINKYAGGRYVPGKRGRKPASEQGGLRLNGDSISMISAVTTSNVELKQVLSKREIELENELKRIRSLRAMIAKSEPRTPAGRNLGSRTLSSVSVRKATKKPAGKVKSFSKTIRSVKTSAKRGRK